MSLKSKRWTWFQKWEKLDRSSNNISGRFCVRHADPPPPTLLWTGRHHAGSIAVIRYWSRPKKTLHHAVHMTYFWPEKEWEEPRAAAHQMCLHVRRVIGELVLLFFFVSKIKQAVLVLIALEILIQVQINWFDMIFFFFLEEFPSQWLDCQFGQLATD